ncbi:MAG: hypothetical protein ACK5XV_05855 [Flavobacteriales bacterium]
MLRPLTLTHIAMFIAGMLGAQEFDFFTGSNWGRYRSHVEAGMGVANFLGDLGGKDGVGTNDLRDIEMTEFNFAGFVGYRRAFLKHLYGRALFSYGRLSGSDRLTNEVFRNNRNLSFRSNVFELNLMAEGWLRLWGKKGHQYKLDRVNQEKGPWRVRGAYFTAFAGLGIFHFNPKAFVQDQWVALHPLRTEGQGLPGGPPMYRRTQINVPVGVSLMYYMHKQWSVGIEAQYRFTFTDYMDDVSSTYFSPDDIALYNEDGTGDLAAYLSNPSLGQQNGGLPASVTAPGQQRGDFRDNDGYLFIMLKTDYWINNSSIKKFNKKRSTRRFRK